MKSNNFEWLLPTPVKGDSWRWGRYVGPLQVEFSPGTVTWVTESLVNPEVGQRVLVRFYSGTRATIMGVLGGIGQGGLKFGLENLTTQNLNDITRGGFYRQPLIANTSSGRNYPYNSAGLLEVFENGNMVFQRYTLYRNSGTGSGVYVRRKYDTTWYAWEELRGTDDGNTIWINGTAYPTSGSVPCPSFSWSGQTSTTTANAVFYGTIAAPIPYSPPAGYTFQWSVGASSRVTFVANFDRVPSDGTQRVRVIQIASAATEDLTRLNWQLVKL